MLHDVGLVVWHNVPKLCDIVVLDPQWLADAMAGVVTFMCQSPASQASGMIDWAKIRSSLKLKYATTPSPSYTFSSISFHILIHSR